MVLILILVVLLLVIISVYRYMTSKPSKRFPPGPVRLPLLGSYFNVLLENFHFHHIALTQMSYKYQSPIIGMYLGDRPVVIANDYKTCKEMFERPEFQGRGYGLMAQIRTKGVKSGLFANDGEDWSHQKRFCLRKMRDLGFGKRCRQFEDILQEEVKDFVEDVKSLAETNQEVPIPEIFYPLMLNCIYELILGTRLPVSQRDELQEYGRVLMRFQNSTHALGGIVSLLPIAGQWLPGATGYAEFLKTSSKQWEFIQSHITQHKSVRDDETDRDFVDIYLRDMQHKPELTEPNLVMCAIDMIFPSVASSSAVGITLMYILQHPEVLKKCQSEVDSVVGRGRLPTLDDRQQMPYTEATIREGLRIMPTSPLSVIHRATEAAKYFDYDIPVNTLMLANIYAMNNDKKLWRDPETFQPERFLDSQGNLLKKDYSLPFGLGKRVCAGETFARQNMFLTLAALFQNFNLQESVPVDFSKLTSGFILNPPPEFKLKLSLRD